MTDSRFLCRMDSLSCALRAAVKVAGKNELAYVRLHRLSEDTLSISALGENVSFRAKLKVDFVHWDDERDDRVELSKHAAASLAGYEVKTPDGLDAEPTVSVTIGQERVRVQDETGLGSSPRVRGRLCNLCRFRPHRGLIPACAGQTRELGSFDRGATAHPRVCGAD